MSTGARPFRTSSIGGRPVGRPRTAAAEPSPYATALIASRRWQRKQRPRFVQPSDQEVFASGEISAIRGAERRAQQSFNQAAQQPLQP